VLRWRSGLVETGTRALIPARREGAADERPVEAGIPILTEY
jgi:hypothetical protein